MTARAEPRRRLGTFRYPAADGRGVGFAQASSDLRKDLVAVNWPHAHLMINHFPVILSVVGAVAAILGLMTRRRMVWTFAAICLTLAGAMIGPVFISGKQASHVIEHLPRPPRKVIDAHEESAEMALFVVLGAGVVGAIAWWKLARRTDTDEPRLWLRVAVTVAGLAAAAATGYTALLGGMIYHGAAGNARPAAWDSVSATPASRPPGP